MLVYILIIFFNPDKISESMMILVCAELKKKIIGAFRSTYLSGVFLNGRQNKLKIEKRFFEQFKHNKGKKSAKRRSVVKRKSGVKVELNSPERWLCGRILNIVL